MIAALSFESSGSVSWQITMQNIEELFWLLIELAFLDTSFVMFCHFALGYILRQRKSLAKPRN